LAPIVVAASSAADCRSVVVRSSRARIVPEREHWPVWDGASGSGVARMGVRPGSSTQKQITRLRHYAWLVALCVFFWLFKLSFYLPNVNFHTYMLHENEDIYIL
jgi:hypothetical protein